VYLFFIFYDTQLDGPFKKKYVCLYIYVFMYVCINNYVCVCMYVSMYVCKHVCMLVCMQLYIRLCVYAYACVCMYVYKYVLMCAHTVVANFWIWRAAYFVYLSWKWREFVKFCAFRSSVLEESFLLSYDSTSIDNRPLDQRCIPEVKAFLPGRIFAAFFQPLWQGSPCSICPQQCCQEQLRAILMSVSSRHVGYAADAFEFGFDDKRRETRETCSGRIQFYVQRIARFTRKSA